MIQTIHMLYIWCRHCVQKKFSSNVKLNVHGYKNCTHIRIIFCLPQDGDTPLMRAVRNRYELIVRQLLDKGARVAVFDKVNLS